jgi:hypothetical protein
MRTPPGAEGGGAIPAVARDAAGAVRRAGNGYQR